MASQDNPFFRQDGFPAIRAHLLPYHCGHGLRDCHEGNQVDFLGFPLADLGQEVCKRRISVDGGTKTFGSMPSKR